VPLRATVAKSSPVSCASAAGLRGAGGGSAAPRRSRPSRLLRRTGRSDANAGARQLESPTCRTPDAPTSPSSSSRSRQRGLDYERGVSPRRDRPSSPTQRRGHTRTSRWASVARAQPRRRPQGGILSGAAIHIGWAPISTAAEPRGRDVPARLPHSGCREVDGSAVWYTRPSPGPPGETRSRPKALRTCAGCGGRRPSRRSLDRLLDVVSRARARMIGRVQRNAKIALSGTSRAALDHRELVKGLSLDIAGGRSSGDPEPRSTRSCNLIPTRYARSLRPHDIDTVFLPAAPGHPKTRGASCGRPPRRGRRRCIRPCRHGLAVRRPNASWSR